MPEQASGQLRDWW